MSGRDSRDSRDSRDRADRADRAERQERADRAARAQAAAARTNEYFVPKDGIDREVITADICRYLGRDALVRPGNYQNPQTGQAQSGFYITAYRNLTTAMIADLKADSERWNEERRATASSGARSSTAEYRMSTIHQSRQYYGPTEAVQLPDTPVSQAAAQGYGASTGLPSQQGVYDSQYSGQQYPQQSSGNYMQAQQGPYPIQQESNNYSYGVEYGVQDPSVDPSRTRGAIPQQGQTGTIPRNNVYAGQSSNYPPVDPRTNYSPYPQSSQQATVSSTQYPQQQQSADPYFNRGASYSMNFPLFQNTYREESNSIAAPAGQVYDSSEYPNRGYPEQQVVYTSASIPTGANPTATAGPSSRRDRDRDGRGHRHDPRR